MLMVLVFSDDGKFRRNERIQTAIDERVPLN